MGFVEGAGRRVRFSVPAAPGVRLDEVQELLAGAAEVDITPPPGMPKAGYSANARTGNGFRTRLRARVVHLRAQASSVALVQCDLLGGSAVLQHLVARRVAASTDVALAGLWIGATHTHAGPGQFLGSDFYNRFASNRAGFDPAFTHFLVDRIAGAVEQAVAVRRPARLAFGRTEVWGLTRNRSLGAHVGNASIEDKRTEPQRKFTAVNPWLHLLRVDTVASDGGLRPLAASVVFSVHGTGISMRTDEYNADVWAYLTDELGHRVERSTGVRPVVGAMEGTHADVAPAIRPGTAGYLEAERIGRAVAAEAAELYDRLEGELTGSVVLGAGLREVDLERSRSIDGIDLPRRAAVGASLVSGAAENLTPVIHRIGPFRAGAPKRRGSVEQGAKWVLGSRWLQPLIVPRESFPRVLPVQVLRIGAMALVGLPFELTVETGRRIEAQVMEAVASHGIHRVVVSSVANEYVGYATTPAEYAEQHYEGGHTLYGPLTQPFLAAHAARLATEVARRGQVTDVVADRRFDLKARRFLARPDGAAVQRRAARRPVFVDATGTADGYWELRWLDVAPGDLRWHEPIVQVEASDGGTWRTARRDGRLVDDEGCDVQVTHLGPLVDGRADEGRADDELRHEARRAGHQYAVRWWNPSFGSGRRHRFVLVANAAQPEWTSEPFD